MQVRPLVTSTSTILDIFDRNDIKNLGRPLYFDLDQFVTTVEMLICSDNIEGAFEMMDPARGFLPAWYREPENYPKILTAIKKTLFKNLYDQYDYSSDFDEANYTREGCREQYRNFYFYPRADILKEAILKENAQERIPWLCELSPSHGAMVLGLLEDGCKFTFFGKNLNTPALNRLKEWLPDGIWQYGPAASQPRFLVNFESMEHMPREADLEQAAFKLGVDFDQIFLSVPYGTLGGGLPDWKTRRLGHLRTYTVNEFLNIANRFFPGYSWNAAKSVSIVLQGQHGTAVR